MNNLARTLFPDEPRLFPGQRWVNIGLRSAHLVGVAGMGAGFLFSLDEVQWLPFWHLALATGVALSLLYVWSSALWLLQLKGLAILFKTLLLAMAVLWPAWRAELFVIIIVISGVVAHAPGRVRGYRWCQAWGPDGDRPQRGGIETGDATRRPRG